MYGPNYFFTNSTNTDTLKTRTKVAVYCCEYFQFIKTVINGFEENNAIAIKKAKHLMKCNQI
jgi:hypothetical protein